MCFTLTLRQQKVPSNLLLNADTPRRACALSVVAPVSLVR